MTVSVQVSWEVLERAQVLLLILVGLKPGTLQVLRILDFLCRLGFRVWR